TCGGHDHRPGTDPAAGPTGGAGSAVDVVHQVGLVGLQLLDRALDDVADADDAGQPSVRHHGDVPDAVGGHRPAQVVDVGIGPAGVHLGRHDLGHGQGEHPRSHVVKPAHHVAFG